MAKLLVAFLIFAGGAFAQCGTLVFNPITKQLNCTGVNTPSVAGNPNNLSRACTPGAGVTIVYDSTNKAFWGCQDTNIWQQLLSTYGTGAFTISALSATPTRGVAASRPSPCVTDSLYIATDTHVMSQCSSASATWATLNSAGYVATWWDTSTHTIHTYDESGNEDTGSGSGGGSGVGHQDLAATWTAIIDGYCQDQTATWTGTTTSDVIVLGAPSGLTAGLTAIGWVSASNTVKMRICNLSGGSLTPGALTFKGTLAVYNLSGTGTINFSSIVDGACSSSTFALTGVASSDPLTPKWPAALESGLTGSMVASAADTVQVRVCNLSGAAVDPASATFGAAVAK